MIEIRVLFLLALGANGNQFYPQNWDERERWENEDQGALDQPQVQNWGNEQGYDLEAWGQKLPHTDQEGLQECIPCHNCCHCEGDPVRICATNGREYKMECEFQCVQRKYREHGQRLEMISCGSSIPPELDFGLNEFAEADICCWCVQEKPACDRYTKVQYYNRCYFHFIEEYYNAHGKGMDGRDCKPAEIYSPKPTCPTCCGCPDYSSPVCSTDRQTFRNICHFECSRIYYGYPFYRAPCPTQPYPTQPFPTQPYPTQPFPTQPSSPTPDVFITVNPPGPTSPSDPPGFPPGFPEISAINASSQFDLHVFGTDNITKIVN